MQPSGNYNSSFGRENMGESIGIHREKRQEEWYIAAFVLYCTIFTTLLAVTPKVEKRTPDIITVDTNTENAANTTPNTPVNVSNNLSSSSGRSTASGTLSPKGNANVLYSSPLSPTANYSPSNYPPSPPLLSPIGPSPSPLQSPTPSPLYPPLHSPPFGGNSFHKSNSFYSPLNNFAPPPSSAAGGSYFSPQLNRGHSAL